MCLCSSKPNHAVPRFLEPDHPTNVEEFREAQGYREQSNELHDGRAEEENGNRREAVSILPVPEVLEEDSLGATLVISWLSSCF